MFNALLNILFASNLRPDLDGIRLAPKLILASGPPIISATLLASWCRFDGNAIPIPVLRILGPISFEP
jgi:hypothetical protein